MQLTGFVLLQVAVRCHMKLTVIAMLQVAARSGDIRGQVHRAVEGILETADASGTEAVEEWEVDELLDWTTTLNFDNYFDFWKAIGTSG